MSTEGARQGKVVGIDLGTTMSVVAQIDHDGTPVTIPNENGDPLTPSVVYLDGTSAVVGKMAKEAAADSPDKVAMFVKRDMGAPLYSRAIDDRSLRPETLSALILRKLRMSAERRIGSIARAVITVPAFFDDARRNATQDAARIAGLDVYDILNEPTAAALSYAVQRQRQSGRRTSLLDFPGGSMRAMVFDLGGGTLDVTVVRLESKRFVTLATDGERQLGGKDWDDRIVKYLGREFQKQFGIDPTEDPHRRATMSLQAENAKKFLSTMNRTQIEVSHAGHTLRATLTRQQFEEMTAPLLQLARLAAKRVVCEQAKLTWDQLDCVLLVGGSTKMPMVKTMLRELTGKEPDDSLDPDQVVAQGAAIHAAILATKEGDGDLLALEESVQDDFGGVVEIPVSSHNLGIAVRNSEGKGVHSVIIRKNTQLPFAASKVYRLLVAGLAKIPIKVLEGDAEEVEHNVCIGDFRFTDLPQGLQKKSPIQVRLECGENGRVAVMALEMTQGKFAKFEIESNRLTEEQIRKEAALVASLDLH